jgi:hypothetical protein
MQNEYNTKSASMSLLAAPLEKMHHERLICVSLEVMNPEIERTRCMISEGI